MTFVRSLVAAVLLAAATTTIALAQDAGTQDAHALIAASDAIRNPDHPFSLTVTLTEYVNARPRESMVVRVLSKQEAGSGQFRSLVRFLEPARDRDKLMLRQGTEVWFYDPGPRTSVRISPQQRLLGQASNGDVVTTNFALDYAAEVIGPETITDADRTPRDTVRLALTATNPAATYARVDYWLDTATHQPVKGTYYSESGRLMKIAYYRGYRPVLGAERPTETLIIDGVDTSRVTRMVFSDQRAEDIPDAWFQRDFLPRFQGQGGGP